MTTDVVLDRASQAFLFEMPWLAIDKDLLSVMKNALTLVHDNLQM